MRKTQKKQIPKSRKRESESRRISGEERKRKILLGAMEVFARKGFHSTTTLELSEALRISEALLFKHFPKKDDLVRAVEDEIKANMDQLFSTVLKLPPTSESLALSIAFNIMVLVEGHGLGPSRTTLDRLAIFSLLGDGRFFRRTTEENLPPYYKFLEECLADAKRRKEINDTKTQMKNAIWFCHHIAAFIILAESSKAISYQGDAASRNLEALEFCLRGLGYTEKAVRKYASRTWLEQNTTAFAIAERLGEG